MIAFNRVKALRRPNGSGRPVRGVVLYRGPSMLDGAPIVVIAITKFSKNRKTGNMVQTYILRADVDPVAAVRLGYDGSICGDCKHRGDGTGRGRSCYVNLGQGPLRVFKSFTLGDYPAVSPVNPVWKEIVSGRVVRIGSYGDPAALPVGFWFSVVSGADSWTGYTHQWLVRDDLRALCMASVDSPAEFDRAQADGWRTFRVRAPEHELFSEEVDCVSLKGVSCADCRLCRGGAIRAKSIAIPAHGGKAVLPVVLDRVRALALV
jgi:hypothetical protein